MTVATGKRRRCRAVFRSEGPIKLEYRTDNSHYNDVIKMMALAEDADTSALRDHLLTIGDYLELSRRFEDQKPTRPDANHTLRVVAKLARDLSTSLERLPRQAVDKLVACLDEGDLKHPCKPGWSALNRVSAVLRELASAAHAANYIPAQRARRIGLPYSLCPELDKLHNQASLAAAKLFCLPQHTVWALVGAQQYILLIPDHSKRTFCLEFINALLRNLERLASAAYRIETLTRGPERDLTRLLAVGRLAKVYETYTGRPATHTATRGRNYQGRTLSPFGNFVIEFLKIADPCYAKGPGLMEAISSAAWPARSLTKGRAGETISTERDKRIAKIITNLDLLQTTRTLTTSN